MKLKLNECPGSPRTTRSGVHEKVTKRTRQSLVTLVVLQTACGGLAAEPNGSEVGSTAAEIRNGDALPAGYAEMVMLQPNGGGCSGELLTNRLILTAKHCVFAWSGSFNEATTVDPTTVWNPRNVTATLAAQSRVADLILWHGSLDVALIRVAQPFTVGGSTTGYRRNVRGTSVATNASLECYGYGNNAFDMSGNEVGFGALRHSTNAVTSTTTTTFTIGANANGQILMGGDSGGACFSGQEIAGVSSRSDRSTRSILVMGSAFRPWLDGLLARFSNGNELDDGFKVRDSLGRIFVVVGDGALWIQSWSEYQSSWAGGDLFQTGPLGLSQVPRDGTLLREPSGEIDVIYGNARFPVPSMQEFYALGFTTSRLRAAPVGALSLIGRVPRDGVALRDRASGEIDVMQGGRRWSVQTLSTYQRVYASWPIYAVPAGGLGAIPYGGSIP